MQMDTQKYSNSTVYIVIAFLAIFIIMPPLCRVLYKEEVQPEDTPVQQAALTDGTMTCTRNFENAGIEITSVATYEDSAIVTNVISIKNPLLTSEGLTGEALKEYSDYSTLFSGLLNLADADKEINGDTVKITLDIETLNSNVDDENVTNHMQDSLSLQNSYEINGFSCTTE